MTDLGKSELGFEKHQVSIKILAMRVRMRTPDVLIVL